MKSLSRIFVVLIILNLMIGTFALAGEKSKAEEQTFTISGLVGLPGVVMQGLPGNPVTDKNGNYSVAIEHGWSGTVMPVKEGYAFDPPSRSYSQVTATQTSQDFNANVITFIISGSVGQEGVTMIGLPDEVMSDSDGSYRTTIPYRWSGKVTPQKEGFIFTPPAKTYTPARKDQTYQNYVSNTTMP